jgi:hypothetical protein
MQPHYRFCDIFITLNKEKAWKQAFFLIKLNCGINKIHGDYFIGRSQRTRT